MAEKEKLLKDGQDAYTELRQSIAGIDEARASQKWLGTWGVREIVIHASGWLEEMRPALEHLGRDEAPYPDGVSYDDFDAWNARFVEAREGVKLADVLAELETAHREFMATARTLPEEHFAPGTPVRNVFESCTSQHYQEHAGQIREWRQKAG